jgi:Methyltransferase FkbM domain
LPVLQCAVMHEEGTVPFNLARNDEGSSVLNLPLQSKFDCVHRETVAIRARTVASILEEIGWASVDLIKMDIEGAEVRILDSLGTEVLDRIKQLTIEFHSAPDFGFNLHDQVEACLKRLRKLGFRVMDFSLPGRYDVLLINSKHIKLGPINRAKWRLTYDPPEPLYRLGLKMRTGLRTRLRRWRKWLTRPSV